MDDILSAALGQSGLNLSFLEEQEESVVEPKQTSAGANNPPAKFFIGNGHAVNVKVESPSFDENEDVSDLLNLLGDVSNETKTKPTGSTKEANNQEECDVLDFLLKYNSDDEELPSPVNKHSNYGINSGNCDVNDCKNNGLTSKFPSLINSVQINRSFSCNETLDHSNKCLLPGIKTSINKNKDHVLKSRKIIMEKLKSTSKFKRANSSPVMLNNAQSERGLKNEKASHEELSDLEKRQQSIRHVLNSPNLTVREKQFLMKSALSHKIKPSSLGVDPSKSLSSLLKRSYSPPVVNPNEEEDEEDENVLMHSETFADYMPAKVKVGFLHPDPVVETSSMASVSPPDVWYSLLLPRDIIDQRKLSALQLESIVYASQQHEKLLPSGKRSGFLIGDGAGVGKGRTVAGIIFENYLHGRKRAIWLSVSNDLRYDAIRDLRDIGCHAKVLPLNKFKYDEKITSKTNGKFKKGCIFATYSSLIGETSSKARFKSRLEQIIHWCGKEFDGVIILDECHKAKNLMPVGSSKPTKTGLTVLQLQDRLPKARIVYCSATGASEPKNMAYMNRLGLWGNGTAFKEFSDFLNSVEKRGVGAMEMVAMDMKLRGMYIARQLSFTGVTFDVQEVKLCSSFIEMYDSSVKLWLDAREKFEKAAELIGLDSKGKKTMWGQFWSAHQRFFKYLCIAAKVKRAVDIAKDAVEKGKCVIFGLQSTGEARTLDQIDDLCGELNDFISTTKGVFSTLVDKHFPSAENANRVSSNNTPITDDKKRKREWRKTHSRNTKRRKEDNQANVEYMSSSDESGTDKDDSSNEIMKNMSDLTSDKETNSGSDSEERDPFAESSSGSDDEDSWLRSASEKKPKKLEKLKLKKISSADSSMSALAAAGINVGKQYAWAKSSINNAATENMKSNRNIKTSIPNGLSQQLLHFKNNSTLKSGDVIEHCRNMKQNLLDQLEIIAPYLPPNTLDELIDELGGPEYVAEMTGRKGRVVAKPDGSFVYEPRSKDDVPLEILNVAEKKRFMDGAKLVAVISEAASSGISLQADRREKNNRRRVHITLELPWSADKAIQQFGRSHRSNQVSAPEYLFLISELAGEQRFASIVAKRLESLGALTHGDRRATESRDLSRYNFDTKYGRQSLDIVLKSVIGHEKPMVKPPVNYQGNFFEDVKSSLVGIGLVQKDHRNGIFSVADKDYTNISRFLNRILGLTVSLQNALFQYFTDTLSAVIKEAKRSGRFDEGIVDLGSQGESVVQTALRKFICPSTSGQVTTELVTVSVERGLSFEKAVEMHSQCHDRMEGFYLSSQLRNGKKTAVLVLKLSGSKKDLYSIYRPNLGLVLKPETSQDLLKKYHKTTVQDVESNWNEQYDYSEENCSHAFWRGYCRRKIVGLTCEVGTRKRACHILCGSVLSVWSKVETILSCQPAPYSKMQILRAKLDSGMKLVGLLIPNNCIDALVKVLSDHSTEHSSHKFINTSATNG